MLNVPYMCTLTTASKSSGDIENIILSRRIAGVVHEHVEAAERVDRGADDVLGALEVGDAVVVRDGFAAAALDDVDDLVGGALVGALAASPSRRGR